MKRQSLRKNIEFLLERYKIERDLMTKEIEKCHDTEEYFEIKISLEFIENVIIELKFALEVSEE